MIPDADVDALAVHADALIEAGDPRGELIALQLAPPSFARAAHIRALVALHGRTWAAPIAEHFSTYEFERGTFVGGEVASGTRWFADTDEAREAAWRRLRVVRSSRYTTDALIGELLDREVPLRAIEFAMPDEAGDIAAWTERRYFPSVEHLAALFPTGGLENCYALTHVQTIAWRVDDPGLVVDWARAAPVVERLARVELAGPEAMAGLVDDFAARAGTLRAVAFEPGRDGWAVRVERDTAPGPFHRIVVTHARWSADTTVHVDALADALRALPAATRITALVFETTGEPLGVPPDEDRKFADALARFGGLAPARDRPWRV